MASSLNLKPSASPVVTYSSGRESATPSSPPDLRLLHFNDVYHLDASSAEPVGGVARFVTLCNEYRSDSPGGVDRFPGQPELVTLFSGDAFNPSLESSVTKGAHMVPVLNKIGADCACVGNHDLDFGVRQFRHLTSQTKFPWLLANILDPALGPNVPLGNAARTHMITTSDGRFKIGLMGLGEREWLETVNSLPPNLEYRSVTEVAKELVPELRAAGADIIIALTHQREPNDNKLAEQMGGEIDLILGGHDHFYAHSLVNGTHVLRSGSDFKQLSYIEVWRRPGDSDGKKWDVTITRRDAVSSVTEDASTLQLVDSLTAKLKSSLEKPIGWSTAPLDARFTTVRTKESNWGNFVCDIMRLHYHADCAIMAAGTIRGDQIYAPGPIRVKDVTDCFPFEDPVVVIKVTGKALWEALESGVSLYPALEGRFPQVSNIVFKFDPSKSPGSRVVSVAVGGAPVDLDKTYILSTRGYMARGRDGYTSLLVKSEGGACEEVVSEENGILISMMLRQYFMALKVMGRWSNWGPSLDRHWSKVVQGVKESHPLVEAKGAKESKTEEGEVGEVKDKQASLERKDGWEEWTPAKLREKKASVTPLGEENGDAGGGYQDEEDRKKAETVEGMDRELTVMRRAFKKWCRLTGVHAKACDAMKGEEYEVDWTNAIAPQVEGRIVMI
ncbi:Metallo-dependent phosphatase-like protein [Bombardia bombarda]|uniref:Metallo-dependent phosphatase-like protein n=1 Tax=Bombardia bombarda TaxID=252184 RepID=A0AA40C1M3_9PEZI|nr:Metallo-dependent phosphatase-like protein [Bombardia bombarda]